MAGTVGRAMINDQHWTTIDLWSDELRSLPEDVGEEEPEPADETPIDWTRFTKRTTRLSADLPLPITTRTLTYESDATRRYLSARIAETLEYWHVRLFASFDAPDPHERFERAKLRIDLAPLRDITQVAYLDADVLNALRSLLPSAPSTTTSLTASSPTFAQKVAAVLGRSFRGGLRIPASQRLHRPGRTALVTASGRSGGSVLSSKRVATLVHDIHASHDDPGGPIAWSIQPQERIGRATASVQHYKIGTNLKLVSAEFTQDVAQHAPVLVRAHDVLTSHPWWELGGRTQELDGDYEFELVVRGQRDVPVRVHLGMDTTVVKRRRLREPMRRTVTGSAGLIICLVPEKAFQHLGLPEDYQE